jgi:ABC-type uncharacterized transport system permease subunit
LVKSNANQMLIVAFIGGAVWGYVICYVKQWLDDKE